MSANPTTQRRDVTLTQRKAWAERLALGWTVLVAAVLFALLRKHGFDDPYITYRYALNVAHGQGFVYNLGERVLSTTTPLYTLLLVPAMWLGLPLPVISNAIGVLSLALGGLGLWYVGKAVDAPYAGLAGLVLYPLFPEFIPTLGAETTFGCMLVVWSLGLYLRQRYEGVAVLVALATLTRADGVLVGGLLLVHWVLTRRQPVPWRAGVICLALVLPWFAWAWWYFGTPFPVTLAAKQHQAQMAISKTFFQGFWGRTGMYWHTPLYWPHFVVAGLGLAYGIRRQRRALLLPLWSAIYFAAYSALRVSAYQWYYAPLVVGFVVLLSLGVEAVIRLAGRVGRRAGVAMLGGALVLGLLVPQALSAMYIQQHPDTRLPIYRDVGMWLQQHTPPDASVGTLEVGIIGYYAERRMIDFAGLIQPQTALQFTRTATYEDAAIWAVERFRPSYLVLRQGDWDRLKHNPYVVRCVPVATFQRDPYQYVLDVYQCPQ